MKVISQLIHQQPNTSAFRFRSVILLPFITKGHLVFARLEQQFGETFPAL